MCSLNQCNAEKTFFFGATVEAGFPERFCSGNGSGLKLPCRSASVQAVPVKRSWHAKGHWWDQKDGINHLRDCRVLSAVCCKLPLSHTWCGSAYRDRACENRLDPHNFHKQHNHAMRAMQSLFFCCFVCPLWLHSHKEVRYRENTKQRLLTITYQAFLAAMPQF